MQVLSLKTRHEEHGKKNLERLGIPPGAWWISLHVREAASLNEHVATHRNADISTYIEAARMIVDLGGWVIRVGDPMMSQLPSIPGVVDYPHSDVRSDWMDIFITANCRFLLSAGSGALLLATVFGRPVVAANFTPLGNGPLSRHDLFIPKLYWSIHEERFLKFQEIFSSDMRDGFRDGAFDRHNVRLIDSTSEQITALTLEMIDRLDGKASYTKEEERLQAEYKAMWTQNPTRSTFGTQSRIGREFLQEQAYLLTSSQPG